jgi:hypothetical protein
MKKPLKSRLIEVLKTNKKIWNRYISFCFNIDPYFSADLRGADLQWVDLRGVNLRGVNIDFSCLDLSCRSLNFKSDEKIRIQIAFHFASLIKNADNATDEEQKIYSYILDYVNKFHRTDVRKLPKL